MTAPDSLPRRVFAGLLGVDKQRAIDFRSPAIEGYSVARRIAAGLLGVELPATAAVSDRTIEIGDESPTATVVSDHTTEVADESPATTAVPDRTTEIADESPPDRPDQSERSADPEQVGSPVEQRLPRPQSMITSAVLDVRVLGPVQLLVDGAPVPVGGPKPRALLAVLAMNRRRVVSSQALAEMMWDDRPSDSHRASLQVFVSNIRRALRSSGVDPAAVLRTEPSGYRLEIPDDASDLGRFELARQAGMEAAALGDHVRAARQFGAALAEWRGKALEDLSGLSFAESFATTMEEERLSVASARIDAEIACGRASSVIEELVAMTNTYPLRESLWAQLVTALYLSGRQAEALDALRRVRAMLVGDLGIVPGPELVELERRVLRQEPLA